MPHTAEKTTVFTCADDETARSTVIALAKEIVFGGVDAGQLDASRNIENLGQMLDISPVDQASQPRYAARLCRVVRCSTVTGLAGD
jgi:predicted dinucleotide-binding enzyme